MITKIEHFCALYNPLTRNLSNPSDATILICIVSLCHTLYSLLFIVLYKAHPLTVNRYLCLGERGESG